METIKQKIKELRKNTDSGFSLLELVVAVGILLILTVSGLISYNQIINNARDARVNDLASDLFMMGATYRSAGSEIDANGVNLEQWAASNNMTFEKIEVEGCEVYKNSVKGEALEIEFSIDKNEQIKVFVKNTSNGYSVEREEPGFDNSCSNI